LGRHRQLLARHLKNAMTAHVFLEHPTHKPILQDMGEPKRQSNIDQGRHECSLKYAAKFCWWGD
jgi:hypothetical protein